MIYLNLPLGPAHGWGICGRQVARHAGNRVPVRLLTAPFEPGHIGNELEYHHLRTLLPPPAEMATLDLTRPLPGPLLQPADKALLPITPGLRGTFTLGYTFFEDTELTPRHLENANHFDHLATGSTWCTDILRRHRVQNVSTVLQGVDPLLFSPDDRERDLLRDKFVVFSGGKFEFRKGQDLVIRAFKALQDRHRDVLLVAAWSNQWEFSFKSMRQSPHIRFEPTSAEVDAALMQVLADNGIDIGRVVLVGFYTQPSMAWMYHNTDVGVFPNRAEGGSNLVLMEYMACGKPVIATASTGHADVIAPEHAMIIGTRGEVSSSSDGVSVARWPEPDLEQTVELLEQAYQQRDRLREMGRRAAAAMAPLTWERTTEQFLELMGVPAANAAPR